MKGRVSHTWVPSRAQLTLLMLILSQRASKLQQTHRRSSLSSCHSSVSTLKTTETRIREEMRLNLLEPLLKIIKKILNCWRKYVPRSWTTRGYKISCPLFPLQRFNLTESRKGTQLKLSQIHQIWSSSLNRASSWYHKWVIRIRALRKLIRKESFQRAMRNTKLMCKLSLMPWI